MKQYSPLSEGILKYLTFFVRSGVFASNSKVERHFIIMKAHTPTLPKFKAVRIAQIEAEIDALRTELSHLIKGESRRRCTSVVIPLIGVPNTKLASVVTDCQKGSK